MITNKKGLSTVVTTLIIILLVLVAIGIIWVVVQNLIGNTGKQIDIQAKCVGISLEIQGATLTGIAPNLVYGVTFKKIGGETPNGIDALFTDGVATFPYGNTSAIVLLNKITTASTSNANINKVTVAAYFLNTNGNKQYCPQTVESAITVAA